MDSLPNAIFEIVTHHMKWPIHRNPSYETTTKRWPIQFMLTQSITMLLQKRGAQQIKNNTRLVEACGYNRETIRHMLTSDIHLTSVYTSDIRPICRLILRPNIIPQYERIFYFRCTTREESKHVKLCLTIDTPFQRAANQKLTTDEPAVIINFESNFHCRMI